MKNKLFMTFHYMEEEIIEKLGNETLDVSPMNDYLFNIERRHMSLMYVTKKNSIAIKSNKYYLHDMSLSGFGILDIQNIYNYVMFNQLPPF